MTFDRYIGEVTYEVSPADSATVSITGGTATISSSTVGTSTITFTDGAGKEAVYTLTVNEAPDPSEIKRIYFETKSFFNDGSANQNVLAYCWNPSTSADNSWPGVAMTWLKDLDNGKKIFYIDVDISTYDHILFVKTVDGSAALKTADIDITSDLVDNNTVYLYDGDWSGMETGITVGFYNGTY